MTFARFGCAMSALLLAAASATAQNAIWIGTPGETGNWTDLSNWDNPPLPEVSAYIQNGGIAIADSPDIASIAIFIHGTDGRSALRLESGGDITTSGEFNLGGHNATGMTGTLEINGGSLTTGDLRAGYAGGNTGIVEVTDGVLSAGYMRLGVHVSRGGTVGGSGVGIIRQSGGVINLGTTTSSLGGGSPGEQFGQLIMTGGALTNNFLLDIGAAAGSYGEVSITNATLVNKRNIRVGLLGTGRMDIHDGASVIMDNANPASAIFTLGNASGAEGIVEMTGGYLSVFPLYVSSGGTGVFRFKGGTIKMDDWRFHMVVGAGSDGFFEQTGGLLDLTTAGTIYLNNAADSTARYHISGGTIDSISDIFISPNPDVGAFRVTGSAPSITIRRIRNDGSTPFLLEFVLDKSLDHISRINMTGTTGYRTGHLRAGLDGGILLTQNNTFTLLRGTMVTTTDYNSRPDPNMWTESFESDVEGTIDESRITLSTGYKMAELDMAGARSASFAARSMGHVTVANLDTSAMGEGFGVYLEVDTDSYGKTPADLVDALVAAGYTNSTTEVEAPYDLGAVIPKAYVLDGASYFAWDFTDVSTGVPHATVSALELSNWPPPPRGSVIIIR